MGNQRHFRTHLPRTWALIVPAPESLINMNAPFIGIPQVKEIFMVNYQCAHVTLTEPALNNEHLLQEAVFYAPAEHIHKITF